MLGILAKLYQRQYTLYSSNFNTNSIISENCLTRACWFSRCTEGVISSEHISVKIWGITNAEKLNINTEIIKAYIIQ